MYTFQDLQECGEDESLRISFVDAAIGSHVASEQYRLAKKAKAYYEHKNPDILLVEKVIYDFVGVPHPDTVTPNHKLLNAYYPLIIDTGTAHLLANGVTFKNEEQKNRLGRNFDGVLRKIFTDARNSGVSYGYFDGENLIHFPFEQFVALPDEYTGTIRAGIRFWRIDPQKPMTAILYEEDGFTVYTEKDGKELTVQQEKRAYTTQKISSDMQGAYAEDSGEASVLPIYPLYNIQKQSAIVGNVSILTAIDLVNSQLINNISEGDLIYWVLQGYGGMDEVDDANFLAHLLKNHVAHTNNEGEHIEPHQITVQFQANESGAIRLKQMLYDNMRGVLTEQLSAGNLTATAINSAYTNQRLNTSLLEYEVIEFLYGIFRIAGIPDSETFSFSYYETINASEQIANVIQSAQFIGDKVSTRLLATYLGVVDSIDEIEAEKAETDLARMSMLAQEEEPEEPDEGGKALQEFGESVLEKLDSILKEAGADGEL